MVVKGNMNLICNMNLISRRNYTRFKDECPVSACVFIYLSYILKNNVEFQRK